MLMLDLLLIPAFIRTDCGFVVSGREALCVLLYRLSFPTRLKDMRLVFGMSESRICESFNWMLHFLDFKWGFLLSLNVERIKPRLREFAKAVYNSGSPLTHCWGFIDGTVRGIARCVSRAGLDMFCTNNRSMSSLVVLFCLRKKPMKSILL